MSFRAQITLLLCAFFQSSLLAADLGFISVSQKYFDLFQLTGSKKSGGGALDYTVQLEAGEVSGGPAMTLEAIASGEAHVGMTKRIRIPVIGKRRISGSVDAGVDGHYSLPLWLDDEGLKAGEVEGGSEFAYGTGASNSFKVPKVKKLVNRIVKRKAGKKAQKKGAKAVEKLDEQADEKMSEAVDEARRQLNPMLAAVTKVLAKEELVAPVIIERDSLGNTQGVKLGLRGNATGKVTKAPPIDFQEQAVATTGIRQELFSEILSEKLKGKKLKLSELQENLCHDRVKKFLDFCEKKLDPTLADMAVLFDEERPVEIEFKEGKIHLRLNASYEVNLGVTFETLPYTLEVVYRAEPSGPVRESLVVHNRVLPTPNPKEKGKHAKESEKSSSPMRAVASFLDPKVKELLTNGFSPVFRNKINLPSYSFATKVHMPSEGKKPVIEEAGSLMPLAVEASEGWLQFNSYYCSSSSFGISFGEARFTKSKQVSIAVKSVLPGSPADLAGFKPGDRIDYYGRAGTAPAAAQGEKAYLDFIAQVGAEEDPENRVVRFSGRSAEGEKFDKKIVLCPKDYPHLEKAGKLP